MRFLDSAPEKQGSAGSNMDRQRFSDIGKLLAARFGRLPANYRFMICSCQGYWPAYQPASHLFPELRQIGQLLACLLGPGDAGRDFRVFLAGDKSHRQRLYGLFS